MTLQSLDRSRPIPRAVDIDVMAAERGGPDQGQRPPARLPICDQSFQRDARRVARHIARAFSAEQEFGCGRWMSQFRNGASSANSHLAGRDELQRPEGDLEIGSVGLEVVESASNAGLQLRGVLAGRAVRRDLVELRGGHFGGCRRWSGWMRDGGSKFEVGREKPKVEDRAWSPRFFWWAYSQEGRRCVLAKSGVKLTKASIPASFLISNWILESANQTHFASDRRWLSASNRQAQRLLQPG